MASQIWPAKSGQPRGKALTLLLPALTLLLPALTLLLPALGADDILRQAHFFPRPDDPPGHVVFPPAVTVCGASWFRVMIIVPTLTVAQKRDQPIIGTVVPRIVVAITEQMCQ